MALEAYDAWLCTDCGLIVANGDDSGIEDAAAHHAAMAAERDRRGPGGGTLAVTGCNEGDPCDFAPPTICGACDPADLGLVDPDDCDHGDPGNTHECRYDRHFSAERCDGCGTTLAGHRFAATELVQIYRRA